MEKENLKKLINKFIKQSINKEDLKTNYYKSIYKDLEIKVSFGQGQHADVTWMAFLGFNQSVSQGIYPVILFDRDKCLVLAYGISKSKPPEIQWPKEIKNNYVEIKNADCNKCVLSKIKEKYSDSYLKECYGIENENLKERQLENLIENLDEIIKTFKKVCLKKGKDMNKKIDKYKNILEQNYQIILQGPPGTGKTRLAKQIARYIIKGKDGIEENGEIEPKIDDIKENVKLIQFHPSYSYEDFVRGIVAKPTKKGISYKVENKILAEMAKKAIDNSENKFILIIDEINRANLSSVLGELIYALEYRGESVESIYELEDEETKEKNREIKLPKNLYIIGTMNTADRSIGHIDYAIRRRFVFIDINSNGEYIENKKAKKLYDKVMKIFTKEYVSPEFYSTIEDIKIGHSYFITENDEELKNKLEYQIKPLLLEYIKDGILNENVKNKIEELKIESNN